MASIDLKNVTVEFPVYNVSTRSIKKNFLRMATGGIISADTSQRVTVNALKDISFSLRDGDRVGLIGHNGAGKSTMLRLLAQIYEPTRGVICIKGCVSPVLDIMHGIESELTGNENIILRSRISGLAKSQIKEKIAEIADFTGLGDYLAMPVRTYSSGMMVRLAFGISTSIKPDILLIDEVFAAGDMNFIAKAKQKMSSLLHQSSIVVMATHSNELIKEFCNKALLLNCGQLQFAGSVTEALETYNQNIP